MASRGAVMSRGACTHCEVVSYTAPTAAAVSPTHWGTHNPGGGGGGGGRNSEVRLIGCDHEQSPPPAGRLLGN